MVYGKATPARDDMILVAVSLDPHGVQEAAFEVPLWEWNLPDDGAARGRGPDARHPVGMDRQASARAARSLAAAVRDLAHRTLRGAAMNAPLTPAPDLPVAQDALWYKDAIIYQLHVKSFFDSNNDGIGDFPG